MENPAAAQAIELFMMEGKARPVTAVGLRDWFFKIRDRVLTPGYWCKEELNLPYKESWRQMRYMVMSVVSVWRK